MSVTSHVSGATHKAQESQLKLPDQAALIKQDFVNCISNFSPQMFSETHFSVRFSCNFISVYGFKCTVSI